MLRANSLTMLTAAIMMATFANADERKAKTVKIGQIEWHLDYDEALKIAIEKRRPLWLHFGEHPG